MPLALRSVAATDMGPVRSRNCDSFHVGPRVLAVADGVDDAPFGDVASALAIDHVRRLDVAPGTLAAAAHAANSALRTRGAQSAALLGMGTTLLAVHLADDLLSWVAFGDSRLHLLRDGTLTMLTSDEEMVRSLLDGSSPFAVGQRVLDAVPGDRLLLGTRGLFDVPAGEVRAALATDASRPEPAAQALIGAVRALAPPENLTVVVADVIEAP